jgi:hypothetical protein
VSQRPRRRTGRCSESVALESEELGLIERGLLLLGVDAGLQRFLLRGARELPAAQRDGGCHRQDGRDGDEPEAAGAARRFAVQGFGDHWRGRGVRPIMRVMKYFVVLVFVGIFASLAFALYFMLKDGRNGRAKSGGMARALTFRIGLSVFLFLCMLLAWKLGYIQPTGLPLGK